MYDQFQQIRILQGYNKSSVTIETDINYANMEFRLFQL